MTEYPTQGRAGSGVVTMKLPKESQGIAAAVIGSLEDRVVVLTNKKHPKPVQLKKAPSGRRDKRGDIVISLNEKEQVISIIVAQKSIEFSNGNSAAATATDQSEPPTAEPAAKAIRANGHSKS